MNADKPLTVRDTGGCTCALTYDPETNKCRFSLVGCKYHEAAASQPWNHLIPWNCPTYWDGCNCPGGPYFKEDESE